MYFLVGSIFFLYEALLAATWCFFLGSAHFLLRPTIKVIRNFICPGCCRSVFEPVARPPETAHSALQMQRLFVP